MRRLLAAVVVAALTVVVKAIGAWDALVGHDEEAFG